MAEARAPEGVPEVLRAQRVELVHPRTGQVRIIIGNIGEDDYAPGIALLDPSGQRLTEYVLFPDGPNLSFACDGNTRVEIGVSHGELPRDDRDYNPLASVLLLDGSGDPVWGYRVYSDGQHLAVEPPKAEGSDRQGREGER